ncbi:Protein of unknown function [Gryllus bimaculatus]|nr:Protein of unknown function [Gryllus bimaculatus]
MKARVEPTSKIVKESGRFGDFLRRMFLLRIWLQHEYGFLKEHRYYPKKFPKKKKNIYEESKQDQRIASEEMEYIRELSSSELSVYRTYSVIFVGFEPLRHAASLPVIYRQLLPVHSLLVISHPRPMFSPPLCCLPPSRAVLARPLAVLLPSSRGSPPSSPPSSRVLRRLPPFAPPSSPRLPPSSRVLERCLVRVSPAVLLPSPPPPAAVLRCPPPVLPLSSRCPPPVLRRLPAVSAVLRRHPPSLASPPSSASSAAVPASVPSVSDHPGPSSSPPSSRRPAAAVLPAVLAPSSVPRPRPVPPPSLPSSWPPPAVSPPSSTAVLTGAVLPRSSPPTSRDTRPPAEHHQSSNPLADRPSL